MPLDEKDMEKVFDLKCKYFLRRWMLASSTHMMN